MKKHTADRQLKQIQLLARASGVIGMCGGQSLDLQAEGKQVSLTHLESIHSAKTGALLEASVQLGAVAAGADQITRQNLNCFAANIGLAFQVQDDILDLTSDTETLGKPQGSDTSSLRSLLFVIPLSTAR